VSLRDISVDERVLGNVQVLNVMEKIDISLVFRYKKPTSKGPVWPGWRGLPDFFRAGTGPAEYY
jgi:hypothetical protein